MRNEDEDQGPPQGPGPEALVPKMQLLMDGVVVFMGDVTVAVSYTHLRAHET